MSDDMFTLDDAENDGKIKREAGTEMAKVARRTGGELFQMFEEVCADKGMDPWQVLGDAVVRALNDEDFSKSLAETEVDMSEVKAGQLRMEDAEFVKEFAEKMGLDAEEDQDDWLEDLFKERLEAKTKSPMMGLANQPNAEVQDEINEIKEQVDRITEHMADSQNGQMEETANEMKDIDDVVSPSDGDVVEEDGSDMPTSEDGVVDE
jgi:hypothetical protein